MLYLSLGYYDYDQDGRATFVYYDADRMIEEGSRLMSSKLPRGIKSIREILILIIYI